MNAILPRASVADMVRQRNVALGLFGEAHNQLIETGEALADARRAGLQASPGINSYNHAGRQEDHSFLAGLTVPQRADFLEAARRMIDRNIWSRLIDLTDLERLMDKEAKDQLRKQLLEDPPEATEDNIFATLETFLMSADEIFKRGIANVFTKLDRRFRSHDGFKIGSRVIIDYVFDSSGFWNYHRNHRDTLMDVERTFCVLDGRAEPHAYAGIVGAIEAARGRHWGARQTYLESDYFRIRAFKNGNVHIYFKRDDLVERVNKLLAEYYGEVIPDGQTTAEDPLQNAKRSMAKNFGFFPTPEDAAFRLIEAASLHRREGQDVLRILEPSAGTGNLAALCVGEGREVDCVEVQASHAAMLRASGLYRSVRHMDFLDLPPMPIYDRVVMNPPFDRERDIDHVMHALKFLKPDGRLVAIMSAGTEFRETRKSIAFREMVETKNGEFSALPEGSFASVGTNINTVIVTIWADGRTQWRRRW